MFQSAHVYHSFSQLTPSVEEIKKKPDVVLLSTFLTGTETNPYDSTPGLCKEINGQNAKKI